LFRHRRGQRIPGRLIVRLEDQDVFQLRDGDVPLLRVSRNSRQLAVSFDEAWR